MKKIIFCFLTSFFLLTSVSALTITGLLTMEDEQFLDGAFDGENIRPEYLNQINASLGQAPDFAIGLFGNERINVTVKMENGGTRKFGIVTRLGSVAEIRKKFITNPTMKINVDESTINKIRNSEEPAVEFVKALNGGEIKYEGVGVVEKAKETGIKAGAFIFDIINGIIGFVTNPFGIFG